ncbi:UNVERIFIED_CONTAM: hypothetical protein K2H54_062486, partial [Gekko kuhli]
NESDEFHHNFWGLRWDLSSLLFLKASDHDQPNGAQPGVGVAVKAVHSIAWWSNPTHVVGPGATAINVVAGMTARVDAMA